MADNGCCAPNRAESVAAEGAATESVSLSQSPARRSLDADLDVASMVELDGGEFLMGTDEPIGFPSDREGPARRTAVAPFMIEPCAVTNAQFADFVHETGYVTDAESYGWSFVFYQFIAPDLLAGARPPQAPWWVSVEGACWHAPHGPGSTTDDLSDHPVVHVSWADATAYCQWAGTRLPTETEWEYAARGGLEAKRYPWGDELLTGGAWQCNIWQGRFPDLNTEDDGYLCTAPVTAYRPNGYGLHNMVGNTWEWCADWFDVSPSSRVMKGGSYLCHDSYCNRYRVAARTANTPDSTTGNTGFRCVKTHPNKSTQLSS
ncbi:MAG: formylglycine-generating enzyme family protein [Propionibacteriales bacterium]|nr:formylglycine-generating enzyme family protein [Propionibacteriales bacterium]